MFFNKKNSKAEVLAEEIKEKQQHLEHLVTQIQTVEKILSETVVWKEQQAHITDAYQHYQLVLNKQLTALLHTLSFSSEIREKMQTTNKGVISALDGLAATSGELDALISPMLEAYNKLRDTQIVTQPFPQQFVDLEEKTRILIQTNRQLEQNLKENNHAAQMLQHQIQELENIKAETTRAVAEMTQQFEILELTYNEKQRILQIELSEIEQKLEEIASKLKEEQQTFDYEVTMQTQIIQGMEKKKGLKEQELHNTYSEQEKTLKAAITQKKRELSTLETKFKKKQQELSNVEELLMSKQTKEQDTITQLEQKYNNLVANFVNVQGQVEL